MKVTDVISGARSPACNIEYGITSRISNCRVVSDLMANPSLLPLHMVLAG